jgi:hypothetical protein
MRSVAGRLRQLGDALNATLFADAPRRTRSFGRGEYAVVIVSVLAIATFLGLLRLGLSVSLNSIWAEDGVVYLQLALVRSFGEAVFTPYAEYLSIVPRLIGEVATAVPIRYAPAAFAISSALLASLSGLAVWFAAGAHIRNPYLRGSLAALTILCPTAGLESLNSGAYITWFMLFAVFWLLLWRPPTWLGTTLSSLFILLTALSNPGVWFYIPIAGLRTIAVRTRRDAMIVAAFWVGAIAQAPVVATHNEQGAEPTWTADIWTAYLQRIVNAGVFGERLGGVFWEKLGWAILIGMLVAVLVGVVAGWLRSGWGRRAVALAAIPTSLVMFIAVAYQREVGSALIWHAGEWATWASRYAIVPALLLVSGLFALLDGSLAGGRRAAATAPWAVAAAVIVAVVAIATSFHQSVPGARGEPRWDTALETAARKCTGPVTEVPVKTSPPGFGVIVACDKIPESLGGPPSG